MHAELPIGAFIAAALVLVPLPWHWRARNVPTLTLIVWLFISNLVYGINAIVWAGNVTIVAPVWCDIVTKLEIGANIGLPACCLCICIHLERISSVRQARSAHSEKVRRMIFDGFMCWGLPGIFMALHYVVQGHRFDIVEDFGCRPTYFVSIAAIMLIWFPPLLFSILTVIFASLALSHFFHRRLTFTRLLQDSNSALTTSRYLRLMAMALVEIIWTVLVTSLNLWFTCRNGLRPWTGWADVHFNFSQIVLYPTFVISQQDRVLNFILWWTVPITAMIFFAFFSFGEDALKEYGACIAWVRRVVFRQNVHPAVSSKGYPSTTFSRSPAPRASIPKSSHSTLTDSKSEFDDDTNHSPSDMSLKHLALASDTTSTNASIFISPPPTPLSAPITDIPPIKYSPHAADLA